MSDVNENRTLAARVVPVALAVLVGAVAVFAAWTFLKAVLFVAGVTAIAIIAGVLGAGTVVVRDLVRRRPVDIDQA